MKKLLLIRHAKAANQDGKDFKRPLTDRGVRDSLTMADQLQSMQLVPELVISSPAYRTKATAELMFEKLGVKNRDYNEAIYEANTHTLLNIIAELSDDYQFAAIVGHNPGISQILYELTGEIVDMPTATVALLAFDFDEWDMVSSDTAKLAWYGTPKGNEAYD